MALLQPGLGRWELREERGERREEREETSSEYFSVLVWADGASCVWIPSSNCGDQLRLSWIITRVKFRSPIITLIFWKYWQEKKLKFCICQFSFIPNILIWIEEIEEMLEKNTFNLFEWHFYNNSHFQI